jgi:Tfp pilus assembly protein PilO
VDNEVIINKLKGNLIGVLCVIAAFFIAFKVYRGKESEIQALKNQRVNEEKKNEVLVQISQLEKKLAELQDNVNNKDISQVLDKIGDFANVASVKIVKIVPLKDSVSGVYTKYPYELSLSAKNYHQIGKFISLLESSPDIYMIDDLFINNSSVGDKSSVSASLTVYTIMVKNENN